MDNFTLLKSLLNEISKKSIEINHNTMLDELGLDSFEIVDFAISLEEKFGVTFYDAEFNDLGTVEDIINLIDNHKQEGGKLC